MFRRSPGSSRPAPASPDPVAEPTEPAHPAPVITIDDATFMDLTEGGITVVDFWASWCGPCRVFAPVFAEAARDYSGRVRFGSCDVDANPTTATLLGIQSIPTLVVFGPDGSELGRVGGAVPRRELDAILERFGPSRAG